ncbi:DUF1054 family protein [Vaginisenegalia massiliensis]|uniref:DUF1054 family protein n=1 Tax=Vaginisenegalia massiliensis TaxID=2058294 RepID=UPI000F543D21|nr:DUF1054 family protein [Vaginisenegalia massiliensis]
MQFEKSDFALFEQGDLGQRMTQIRTHIQPKFAFFGAFLAQVMKEQSESTLELPVHIAQHLRRTVYPPESTWVAIGGNKRGYKKFPHFHLLINKDYLFFGLALIDQPMHEGAMAQLLLDQSGLFDSITSNYVIIPDHTQAAYYACQEDILNQALTRLRDVKKAEFMLGRMIAKDQVALLENKAFQAWLKQTVIDLFPIYQALLACQASAY